MNSFPVVQRKSPIAGSWYQGTPDKLNSQIKQAAMSSLGVGHDFSIRRETDGRNLVGVVSPHAGYMYSGPTATYAYATLRDYHPDLKRLYIIGPDHRGYGYDITTFPEGAWNTPLGDMQISKDLLESATHFGTTVSAEAHAHEHSIDIQLPMIQYAYGKSPEFLPLMLTQQSLEQSKRLGKYLSTKKEVMVASSDLSHEYNYETLVKNDREMIEHLLSADLEEVEKFRKEVGMTSCGFGAIYTLIHAANLRGKVTVEKLAYSNSAMVTGRKAGQYTVGYVALAVYVEN